MKVLVVGGGGREHALCWKIKQSPLVDKVFCAPGNAGISKDAECVDIAVTDFEKLVGFVKKNRVDLTVVGPEQPLSLGIVDRFEQDGLNIFGPSMAASEIESSKVFAKNLMKKYGIPTANYSVFDNYTDATGFLKEIEYPIVIKADGLAAGKGVMICEDIDVATKALDSIMNLKLFGESGSKVVIEQFLVGEEASFFVFTDGKSFIPLESSQDHKALLDGDKGPNTGGMGAYSPAPIVDDKMREKIISDVIKPTIDAMNNEGRNYKGVLYVGLMIRGSSLKVLEYNCRFGDPEAQPLMMRMNSDIVPLMQSIASGELEVKDINWKNNPSVCIIMASKGYPGEYKKGIKIEGLNELDSINDIVVFHSATANKDNMVVTNGGRVLGLTSLGNNISDAIGKAYDAVKIIDNDTLHYRTDIGKKALVFEG